MSEQVTTPIAEGAETSVESVKPMTEQDFLSSRIAKFAAAAPKAPSAEPESEPEAQPEAEAQSKESAQKPKDETKAKVPSQINLEELSEAELGELAQKLGSKAVARYGELTAKRKQAEEQLQALRNELASREQQKPLEPKVENNPYATVKTTDELSAKVQEVNAVVEWAEDVLFKAEDLGASDVVAVHEGKELTKAEVRDYLRNARKARDKYLPAQHKELIAAEQRRGAEEAFRNMARQELTWLDGEDNDTRKVYESMVSDPLVKRVKEAVPEFAPMVEYLVAHAANSKYGRKVIEPTVVGKPKLTPPASPSAAAAAPERADARTEKALKDVHSRFLKTGNTSDWIALRTAQLSKTRK